MKPTLAVIGFGRRARMDGHFATAGFEVVAAADPDETARTQFAEHRSTARVYADHREMLERERPTAVLICSPDYLHAEHACDALARGAAVYCEKPLAITLPDCDRILDTAVEHAGRLYVGHNMRHFASMLAMKKLIDDGAIGQVQAAWCRHFICYGGDAYFKDWHAEQAKGTGLLLQKGAHDIDVLHWLCGARTQRVVGMGRLSVYDRCAQRSRAEPGDATFREENWPPLTQTKMNPDMDVEDHNMVLMQLENGVQCSYLQCHYSPDSCRNYTIIGDAGRIENYGDARSWEVRCYLQRTMDYARPDQVIRGEPAAGGHGGSDPRIVQEFADHVLRGAPTSVSAIGARDAVAVGILATESLRNGNQPFDVPAVSPEVAAWFGTLEAGNAK